MKYSDSRDCYMDLIRRGSAELAGSDTKKKNSEFIKFMRRVFILRVFQG